MIDLPTLCELVNDSASLRPPHTLTLRSLDKFHEILLSCNSYQSTIGHVTGSGGDSSVAVVCGESSVRCGDDYAVLAGQGHIIGMDYVFMVLIDATDDAVARQAAHMLVKMYIKPYSDFPRCWPSWTGCARSPGCLTLHRYLSLDIVRLLLGLICSA